MLRGFETKKGSLRGASFDSLGFSEPVYNISHYVKKVKKVFVGVKLLN